MRVLALETSTILGGVAIMEDETLIAESRVNVRVAHSERVLKEIDHLLRQSALSINDIDVFACAIGPGSFTGLRVGLSTVKGLVYATGRRLVTVPTLEAFAWNTAHSLYPVCPLLDARKKEVYAGIFEWVDGGFVSILAERPVRIKSLLSGIHGPAIFLGEGALLYRDIIKQTLGENAIFAPPQKMVPAPSNVAYLGMIKAREGVFDDPERVMPLYLRKSEAEIKEDNVPGM